MIFAEPFFLRAFTTPFELTLTTDFLLDLYVSFLLAFLGDTEALSFFFCPFFSTSMPELPTLTPMETFLTLAAALDAVDGKASDVKIIANANIKVTIVLKHLDDCALIRFINIPPIFYFLWI